MHRILIHAGFHKTGTTGLQETLRTNQHALQPKIQLVLRPGMKALCASARAYSRSRSDLDLGLVKYEASLLLDSLHTSAAEIIILSSEDLSGHMPGRYGLRSYGAAPHVMRALALACKTTAPKASCDFFFTTRAGEPWLRSCYSQHLLNTRMVMDETEYVKRFAPFADHTAIIAQVEAEVPDNKVTLATLEAGADAPLGIAGALLDCLDLDPAIRAALVPTEKPATMVSEPSNDQLLALNRSDLDDASLRAEKRMLLKGDA